MSGLDKGVDKVAEAAGLGVVTEGAVPFVIIPGRDSGDLHALANRLGEYAARLDIFMLNGDLITFNSDGEQEVMDGGHFRGWIMQHVVTCERCHRETGKPIPKPLSRSDAATVLKMDAFKRGVRKIVAVNHVRLPVVRQDEDLGLKTLEQLPWGYDEATQVYTVPGGLEYGTDTPLNIAQEWVHDTTGTFPFSDPRSLAVQIAAMHSMFSKHLLPEGCLRPGFLWLANKPSSGKTVLAKMVLFTVCGRGPVAKLKKDADLDKELEAFARASVPFVFFDNVRSGLDSPSIEQMMTSGESTGRAMGGHGVFGAKNTMLLLVTGNRLELNEDTQRRFLVVDLFEKGEPAERVVGSLLSESVMRADAWRKMALECLYAMVKAWFDAGMPKGETELGSFEEYSRVIGGIVKSAGFADPLVPAEIPDAINPERAEFEDLLRAILEEMEGESKRDFTLEDLCALARSQNLFVPLVGDQAQGVKLTIKEDGITGEHKAYAQDRGLLTPSQRQKWNFRLQKEVGREPKVEGQIICFGSRSQSRKTTFTIEVKPA